MQVILSKNAPKARCYKCGTSSIQYICHHCGRPMCEKHTSFISVRDNVNSNHNNQRKLLSTEFKGLMLNETECGEESYHCEDHVHIVPKVVWKRILLGIILLFISLFIIPNNSRGIKLLLGLTGGGIIGYSIYNNLQRKPKILISKPDFPLLPTFDKIQIQEKIEGRITLDSAGNYTVKTSTVQGQLDVFLSLNPKDLERLKIYRKKYNSAQRFHAGFAVLQGSAGIIFNEDLSSRQGYVNCNGVIIPLVNQIATQRYLNGQDERNSHKEHFSNSYALLETPGDTDLLIQLVLSFLPETDQRGIELRVQKKYLELNTKDNRNFSKLKMEEIKLLEVKFPVSWGRIINLSSSSHATINEHHQTITWENVFLSQQEIQVGYYIFKIQYENQINPLESFISGKIKVIFSSALSGLEGVKIYFPNGNKTHSARPIEKEQLIQTEVHTDFELSLATLRYQHIREISESNKNSSNFNRDKTFTFPGISPNHVTITLITDKISEQGFYVKQVIETPPITESIDNINVIKRRWTIFGRWYEGVFPIDFQLSLSGQEAEGHNLPIFVNQTTISLTVTGSYSNQDMEDLIVSQWETLYYLIHDTLQQIFGDNLYYEPEALPPSFNEVPLEAEIVEDAQDEDE